jgi:peroxiredoxin
MPDLPAATPALLERPLVRAVLAGVLLAALAASVLVWRAAGDDGGGAEGLVPVASRPAGLPTAVDEPAAGPLDDRSPIVGQPAPDFELRDLDGDAVRLSDYRGRVVFINFWASWCRPCKKELPIIQDVYEEKAAEGLVVLAVNWEDGSATAREYADALGLTMPVLNDARGEVYGQYLLRGLPDSFFVDSDGTLAALQYGELSESKMRERLAAAGLP